MRRIVWLGVVTLAFGLSLAALWVARGRTRTPAHAEDYAHLARSEAVPAALFTAPAFSFRDQHGTSISKGSLAGKPFVANFVFTTCRTVCPLLTSKFVRLQRETKGAALAFVSFSVDPEHDTQAALAAYAQRWNPEEPRWHLLETTPAGLQAVTQGFRVTADRADSGPDAVIHSAVFVLVDARGEVRGVYDADDATDFRLLLSHARALTGADQGTRPARSGEVLFHELSCPTCHEAADLAPPLGGLIGEQRELDTGAMVVADEAYVRESILAPQAKRVRGYPLRMPSFEGSMTDGELEALVQWVSTRPAPVKMAADATVERDPVCHMQVRVGPETPRAASADGGVVHFCSAWCEARFKENPDAYR